MKTKKKWTGNSIHWDGFSLNEGGRFFCSVFRFNSMSFWIFFYVWVNIRCLRINDRRLVFTWLKGKKPQISFGQLSIYGHGSDPCRMCGSVSCKGCVHETEKMIVSRLKTGM